MILDSPLDEKTVRSLKVGDTVYLRGRIITGRDEMHIRALDYVREGKEVPADIYGSTIYHCGPIMAEREGVWYPIAAGPTTSARMNSLEPEMIRTFGIRAIIGKGGMSTETSEAMAETGCVYLAAVGGTAVSLADGLGVFAGREWSDLGMAESIWKFDAEKFGPLTVAMDSEGGNLYEQVRKNLRR
ncbi:MAG: FumA C-terminus/TtdB family hydratase beta subunit [Candidatus Methanomethylophilaceae archaeon]|jgi:fumarate hydratase subunit beta